MAVFFFTLGCKLNRLETEALAAAFRDAGFPVFHGTAAPPDGLTAPEGTADGLTAAGGAPELAVINTCTVTSKAEQKARRIIRFCLRRFRAVLVTGCYAELEAASLAALGSENPGGGPLLVVPGSRKDRLLDLPRYLADRGVSALGSWDAAGPPAESLPAESPPGPAGGPRAGPFRFTPERIFHSRPFLKIQDGCDRRCAYCRVPLARGRSVSLDRGEILRRLIALERAGLAEAVITGVNICQYRDDGGGGADGGGLSALLRFLLKNTSRIALRLSSIEPEPALFGFGPGEKGAELFEVLSHPRIRPHFHLSVQSGSAGVLAAMGRPYGAENIFRLAEGLRRVKNDPFLACDLIAGFPGEGDDDFEETLSLCRLTGFAWIHGFPFSPRPGTPAASLGGRVSPRVSGERLAALAELAERERGAYVRRWRGKTVDAVAGAEKAGFFAGLTDNYIRVRVPFGRNGPAAPGKAFRCRLGEPCSEGGKKLEIHAELRYIDSGGGR